MIVTPVSRSVWISAALRRHWLIREVTSALLVPVSVATVVTIVVVVEVELGAFPLVSFDFIVSEEFVVAAASYLAFAVLLTFGVGVVVVVLLCG